MDPIIWYLGFGYTSNDSIGVGEVYGYELLGPLGFIGKRPKVEVV